MNTHPRALPWAAAAVTSLLAAPALAQAPAPAGTYELPPGVQVVPAQAYAPPPMDPKEFKRMIRRWEPGDPIPAGYHPEERPRVGLVAGGASIFGVFWLGSLLGGVLVQDRGYLPLVAPIVGPLITLGTARTDDLGKVLLALDSFVQAGGAAMLIAGIVATKPRLVRDEARSFVLPTPMRVGTGSGIGLVGQF
jgi:hypothetical protein